MGVTSDNMVYARQHYLLKSKSNNILDFQGTQFIRKTDDTVNGFQLPEGFMFQSVNFKVMNVTPEIHNEHYYVEEGGWMSTFKDPHWAFKFDHDRTGYLVETILSDTAKPKNTPFTQFKNGRRTTTQMWNRWDNRLFGVPADLMKDVSEKFNSLLSTEHQRNLGSRRRRLEHHSEHHPKFVKLCEDIVAAHYQ